jgi:hypothetical protein
MSAEANFTYHKCCDVSDVKQNTNGDSYIKFSISDSKSSNTVHHLTIWSDNPKFEIAKKVLRKGDYYNITCKISQTIEFFSDPKSKKKVPVPFYNFNVKDLEWIDIIKQPKSKSKPTKQTLKGVEGGAA